MVASGHADDRLRLLVPKDQLGALAVCDQLSHPVGGVRRVGSQIIREKRQTARRSRGHIGHVVKEKRQTEVNALTEKDCCLREAEKGKRSRMGHGQMARGRMDSRLCEVSVPGAGRLTAV